MLKFCDSSPCDFNQALFQVNNKLIFKHQALTDVALVFRFAQSWDNEELLICEKNPYNREVKGTLMSSPFTGRCHKQPLVDCLLFKECFCHLGTKFTYFAIKMQNLGRSAWLFCYSHKRLEPDFINNHQRRQTEKNYWDGLVVLCAFGINESLSQHQ